MKYFSKIILFLFCSTSLPVIGMDHKYAKLDKQATVQRGGTSESKAVVSVEQWASVRQRAFKVFEDLKVLAWQEVPAKQDVINTFDKVGEALFTLGEVGWHMLAKAVNLKKIVSLLYEIAVRRADQKTYEILTVEMAKCAAFTVALLALPYTPSAALAALSWVFACIGVIATLTESCMGVIGALIDFIFRSAALTTVSYFPSLRLATIAYPPLAWAVGTTYGFVCSLLSFVFGNSCSLLKLIVGKILLYASIEHATIVAAGLAGASCIAAVGAYVPQKVKVTTVPVSAQQPKKQKSCGRVNTAVFYFPRKKKAVTSN